MKTSYFTFGQQHTHSYNGFTLDKDSVVRITTREPQQPRDVMVELFGQKWSMEYDEPPFRTVFPGRWVFIAR